MLQKSRSFINTKENLPSLQQVGLCIPLSTASSSETGFSDLMGSINSLTKESAALLFLKQE